MAELDGARGSRRSAAALWPRSSASSSTSTPWPPASALGGDVAGDDEDLRRRRRAPQRGQDVGEHRLGQRPARAGLQLARPAAAWRRRSVLTGRTARVRIGAARPLLRAADAREARASRRRRRRRARRIGHRARRSRARGRRRRALVGDEPVEQRRRSAAATPSARAAARPSAMNGSVGPLSTAPPTSGRHGDDRAPGSRPAPRACPGTARIGPIEITGFDGPITIARGASRSPRAPRRVGARRSIPSKLDVLDRALAAAEDHELLERPTTRPCARTRVRTGSSHIGSTRARTPSAAVERRQRLGQALAARPAARRALDADREVAVAEVEPDVAAELAQPVHHRERVAGQAPAALVDPVGEPEGDEVGVGGDVGAVDLDVVAGVGDHDELVGRRRRACPRASFAPPVPPARTTTAARPQLLGQAGDPDAGAGLVADVDADHQRRELLE